MNQQSQQHPSLSPVPLSPEAEFYLRRLPSSPLDPSPAVAAPAIATSIHISTASPVAIALAAQWEEAQQVWAEEVATTDSSTDTAASLSPRATRVEREVFATLRRLPQEADDLLRFSSSRADAPQAADGLQDVFPYLIAFAATAVPTRSTQSASLAALIAFLYSADPTGRIDGEDDESDGSEEESGPQHGRRRRMTRNQVAQSMFLGDRSDGIDALGYALHSVCQELPSSLDGEEEPREEKTKRKPESRGKDSKAAAATVHLIATLSQMIELLWLGASSSEEVAVAMAHTSATDDQNLFLSGIQCLETYMRLRPQQQQSRDGLDCLDRLTQWLALLLPHYECGTQVERQQHEQQQATATLCSFLYSLVRSPPPVYYSVNRVCHLCRLLVLLNRRSSASYQYVVTKELVPQKSSPSRITQLLQYLWRSQWADETELGCLWWVALVRPLAVTKHQSTADEDTETLRVRLQLLLEACLAGDGTSWAVSAGGALDSLRDAVLWEGEPLRPYAASAALAWRWMLALHPTRVCERVVNGATGNDEELLMSLLKAVLSWPQAPPAAVTSAAAVSSFTPDTQLWMRETALVLSLVLFFISPSAASTSQRADRCIARYLSQEQRQVVLTRLLHAVESLVEDSVWGELTAMHLYGCPRPSQQGEELAVLAPSSPEEWRRAVSAACEYRLYALPPREASHRRVSTFHSHNSPSLPPSVLAQTAGEATGAAGHSQSRSATSAAAAMTSAAARPPAWVAQFSVVVAAHHLRGSFARDACQTVMRLALHCKTLSGSTATTLPGRGGPAAVPAAGLQTPRGMSEGASIPATAAVEDEGEDSWLRRAPSASSSTIASSSHSHKPKPANPWAPTQKLHQGRQWGRESLKPSDVLLFYSECTQDIEAQLMEILEAITAHTAHLHEERRVCPTTHVVRRCILQDLYCNVYPRLFSVVQRMAFWYRSSPTVQRLLHKAGTALHSGNILEIFDATAHCCE